MLTISTNGNLSNNLQPSLIWNISDKEFLARTSEKIYDQILDVPWKTPGKFTHAPTLESILSLCYAIKSWLDISNDTNNNNNISFNNHLGIIHCSNGKTRTGILIACVLKYMGSFQTSTDAFQFFCEARANSAPVLSPSYRIFFSNFDTIVNSNGKFPNPSQCIHLSAISISGLPVDELPSIEIWDSLNGLIFSSHDIKSDENICIPTDKCTWSDQYGDGYFSTDCNVVSDFAVICRFGGNHADVKDKTTLIFKYQNNAAFFTTHGNATNTIVLKRNDVDVNPEYADSLENDTFLMNLSFTPYDSTSSTLSGLRSRTSSVTYDILSPIPVSRSFHLNNNHGFLFLPPNKRGSFERGLEEVNIFYMYLYSIYLSIYKYN